MSERTITDGLREAVEGAEALALQLSPVRTARTEQNINTAHEMAERLKIHLRNLALATPQQEQARCGSPVGIDLRGSESVGVVLPDGTEADLLAYVLRDATGSVQVMQREDAEVDKDEVVAALTQPDHPVVPEQVEDDGWPPGITLMLALHLAETAIRYFGAECPDYGEATEHCDCLTCRTQMVITEWEDHPRNSVPVETTFIPAPTEPSYGGEGT